MVGANCNKTWGKDCPGSGSPAFGMSHLNNRFGDNFKATIAKLGRLFIYIKFPVTKLQPQEKNHRTTSAVLVPHF